jgi:5-methyltetrahydropteroyltriglutamate--homocysteine methyltransferase
MVTPTEPIGSLPRPIRLIKPVSTGDRTDPTLDLRHEAAVRDTIAQLEATGSPVITDREQLRGGNWG